MKINDLSTRNKIIELCKINNKFADNDKALVAAIWQNEGWSKGDTLYNNLSRVTNYESIRRSRAKLVAEGVITPSESVTNARRDHEQEARVDLGHESSDYL